MSAKVRYKNKFQSVDASASEQHPHVPKSAPGVAIAFHLHSQVKVHSAGGDLKSTGSSSEGVMRAGRYKQ